MTKEPSVEDINLHLAQPKTMKNSNVIDLNTQKRKNLTTYSGKGKGGGKYGVAKSIIFPPIKEVIRPRPSIINPPENVFDTEDDNADKNDFYWICNTFYQPQMKHNTFIVNWGPCIHCSQ